MSRPGTGERNCEADSPPGCRRVAQWHRQAPDQRRTGAVKHPVHGSVSRYCCEHAHCPVLVVPPAERASR